MNYYKINEHNQLTNQTITYFIPVEGNEEAMEAIADFVDTDYTLDDEFTIDLEPVNETEVETLGALDTYTILSGAIDKDNIMKDLARIDRRPLYKGGIGDYMHE
jgi:hypothetical protein